MIKTVVIKYDVWAVVIKRERHLGCIREIITSAGFETPVSTNGRHQISVWTHSPLRRVHLLQEQQVHIKKDK